MDLSPEDRQRIEAEERLRYEIRGRLRRRLVWKCAIFAGLALLALLIIGMATIGYKFSVGSEVTLSRYALTFGSQDALDQFEQLPSDKAVEIARGAYSIPAGTRVRIVKSDGNRRCIVPVDGGEEGWIEMQWLAKYSQ